MEEKFTLVVPEFMGVNEKLALQMDRIQEAESRIHEIKVVSPATHKDLEFLMNEGYRQAKQNLIRLEHLKLKAERQKEREKARVILDVIPPLVEGRPQSYNNADFRAAILARDTEYTKICEHMDQLTHMIKFFEIRITVFEKACKIIHKSIDMMIRSTSSSTLGLR